MIMVKVKNGEEYNDGTGEEASRIHWAPGELMETRDEKALHSVESRDKFKHIRIFWTPVKRQSGGRGEEEGVTKLTYLFDHHWRFFRGAASRLN